MKKRITLIVFSVLIIVALYVLYCFNYIPHKKYTNADFNIEAYKSNIDKDNDGIDDQTDILNNANNYIKSLRNRLERPFHGHRGGSRGRIYYRFTTFEERALIC